MDPKSIGIEAQELRKRYGARLALDSVSLQARAGEVVGLLGPNGAGKTTTLSSRDSVLPIGSVAAMVMSAVGGCWWPLAFEPSWMRTLALVMSTTWTRRAFNDIMIRGLEAGAALWPPPMVFMLGMISLIAGIARAPRLYR